MRREMASQEVKTPRYELDRANMRGRICGFAEQLTHAVELGRRTTLPREYARVEAVVCLGMGGSAIGGDLLRCYLADTLKVPLVVNRDYLNPAFVGSKTLVIASSYSGNTEETLSAYVQAKERGAKVLCITSGGELARRAQGDGVPVVLIPGGYPPRTALAYLAVPALLAFEKLGFVPPQEEPLKESAALLSKLAQDYDRPEAGNQALAAAQRLVGKLPVIYTTSSWEVVGMRWRGQLSENSKVLAYSSTLPEMNHNEIVGWGLLEPVQRMVQVVLLRDRGDHPRVQMRMEFLKELVARHSYPAIELFAQGQSRLARILSLIHLGDWVSYYLALYNEVDPTPVKNIEMLKERLSKL
ncbi:MAG: bifunctional phosphoglucose/phosphomannose isomerase [candidate division KSB1 bacterium]|nr:bifunctional phosphoglucose/phosphomannose isomerase [candidate division KSB1 bacterium]